MRICFPNELIPGPYPYGWPDVGDLTAGDMFSIAWRCLDAQLCSAEHNLLAIPCVEFIMSRIAAAMRAA